MTSSTSSRTSSTRTLSRDFLVDITKSLKDDPKLASPDFKGDNFTTFINYFKNADGDVFGVPMEAFVKVYLYRKDLFDDPKNKEAFKAKYGYDLAPAKDHKQYRDIAEFFTQWGKDNDQELWGSTVQAHTGHPASWYEFFESVAPTFGVYNWGINQDGWSASEANGGAMNSAKAKAALEYWLGLLKFAPPESTSSTWDEVAASFAAGRAAQGLVYGENAAWIATNADKSNVVGKVGVALPPLEPGVLEDAESGKGYIGYYDGGAFGIPFSSKNQEAALLFLQYIGQNEGAGRIGRLRHPRITNQATYDDPKVKDMDAKTGRLLHAAEGSRASCSPARRRIRSTPRCVKRPRRSSTRRSSPDSSSPDPTPSTRWRTQGRGRADRSSATASKGLSLPCRAAPDAGAAPVPRADRCARGSGDAVQVQLGWLLLAPTLLILVVFGILPFVYVLVGRLHELERLRRRPDAAFLNWRRELPPAGV